MNELNNLQTIWKSGETGKKNFGPKKIPDGIIQKLKKLETNQTRINRLKIFVLIMIFVQMVYWLNRLDAGSMWVYAGIGIIISGVSVFMVHYMKNQFNIKNLDFSSPSIQFIDKAAKMLENQNDVFKRPFLLLTAWIVIGANVMAFGFTSAHDDKFTMHMIYTFLVLVSTFWGHRIRMWRIRKETLPLIEELKTLKADMKEG